MKLILTGGFLGSGKTTAIQHACNLLLKEKVKVAVITNDQGEELVDSKYLQNFLIPVKEVRKDVFVAIIIRFLKTFVISVKQ